MSSKGVIKISNKDGFKDVGMLYAWHFHKEHVIHVVTTQKNLEKPGQIEEHPEKPSWKTYR